MENVLGFYTFIDNTNFMEAKAARKKACDF